MAVLHTNRKFLNFHSQSWRHGQLTTKFLIMNPIARGVVGYGGPRRAGGNKIGGLSDPTHDFPDALAFKLVDGHISLAFGQPLKTP